MPEQAVWAVAEALRQWAARFDLDAQLERRWATLAEGILGAGEAGAKADKPPKADDDAAAADKGGKKKDGTKAGKGGGKGDKKGKK